MVAEKVEESATVRGEENNLGSYQEARAETITGVILYVYL